MPYQTKGFVNEWIGLHGLDQNISALYALIFKIVPVNVERAGLWARNGELPVIWRMDLINVNLRIGSAESTGDDG